MDIWQTVVAVGSTGAVIELIRGVIGWRTGATTRRRADNRQKIRDFDREYECRLSWQEYGHEVRRVAIDWGIPAAELPVIPKCRTSDDKE